MPHRCLGKVQLPTMKMKNRIQKIKIHDIIISLNACCVKVSYALVTECDGQRASRTDGNHSCIPLLTSLVVDYV